MSEESTHNQSYVNIPKIDYWMYGIIKEALRTQPRPDRMHKGCSVRCDNKFCDTGKINLTIQRIEEIQDAISEQAMRDMQ